MPPVTIRLAGPSEAARVHALMLGLADHQGETPYLAATPASLAAALGGDAPRAWCLLAEMDGRDVGYLRSILRPDGKIVSVYYLHVKGNPTRFIGGTIWKPEPK